MSANRSLILWENELAFWTYKRHDNKSQHLFIRAVPSKENIAAVINGYEKSIDIVIQTGSWCYNNTIYDSARQLLENRSGLDDPQKCSLKKLAAETRKNHCLLPVYGPAGATGCILISKHEITRRCGNGVDWKIAGKKILEDCSKKVCDAIKRGLYDLYLYENPCSTNLNTAINLDDAVLLEILGPFTGTNFAENGALNQLTDYGLDKALDAEEVSRGRINTVVSVSYEIQRD